MNFTLRPYQQEFADNISRELGKKQRIIACAATGSGKTKTFVYITHKIVSAGRTPLIITESRKIFDQIKAEFDSVFEINAKVKECLVYKNGIYVAMAQTLAKRQAIVDQFVELGKELVVIVDEAHIGTPTKLLKQLMDSYMIGFTATPSWKDAKHLTELYNGIVVGAQPQWLIENGYLSPYYHYARVTADLKQLKIVAGEFSQESQEAAFEKAEVYKGLYDDLNTFKYYKAMIFCSNKLHADRTGAALEELGHRCAVVHTGNPNADHDLYKFKTDPSLNICISVGQLTKGFDFPPADLIILNRATTSLPLYLQMCGRGSRTAEGKERFSVLDYGGNAKRLGLWNIDRDWEELWCAVMKKRDSMELDDLKDCPRCGYICLRNEMVCPDCGHEFNEQPKRDKDDPETVLMEITLKYNHLRGRKLSSLTPAELVVYRDYTGKKKFSLRVARSKGANYLEHYARICGYKAGYMEHNGPNERLRYQDVIIK